MKGLKYIIIGVSLLSMFACVPLNQLTDTKKKADRLQDENQLLKDENRELTVDNNELDGQLVTLQKRYLELEKQVENLKDERDELIYSKESLERNQKDLERQINMLKEGSSEEISKLLNELQTMQENLQEREDRVYRAEEELKKREEELARAQNALEAQQQKIADAEEAMAQQQARMMELQEALDNQKKAVNELKEKLNLALRGFYDQGLSVYEKNGKVYVSLEENLLFRTGSYNLGSDGQKAIESLSGVLAANPEINIMVEGHTDNVPFNGTGTLKDNWDLSVMRATAVTKIILNNAEIDPARITAAGRSEYVPLDDANTPEARRKNRRTEIILTPDLSTVFDIIQSN
ncbi:MAG: OmpA family protein [Prolixibacteraceae bacterium]|jgi:chemotaxis protein MotB|nr:OmpA family protein [Prolixibacteraceae bacterium]